MSSDEQKIPLILTPEMRERINNLVNANEATRALTKQVDAELKQDYFQEKDRAK